MPANEIEIDLKVESDPNALDKFAAGAKAGAAKAGTGIVEEIKRAGDRVEAEARRIADAMSDRLSDMPRPRFDDSIVKPAQQAGEDAGAGIVDGMSNVDFGSVGGSMMEGLAMLGPVGAAVGMAVGEELAAGIDHGFNQDRNLVLDSVRSGIPESEMRAIGDDAGEAFSAGFGEGLREMEQAGALIQNTMRGLDEDLQMPEALKAAATLEEVWGVDIPTSLQIARDLVTSGLAPDTVTAYRQMADAQQAYQLDAMELNDVMEEFSSFMGRLGMDGATAWRIIGEATRQNVFPTIDRAGEMFEEFVITMQEGTAETRRQLEIIGLDADEMFRLFNEGRGDEALARISTALANTEDKTVRNTAALEIFKMAFEGATDPQLALEIYAQADAVGELGTALEDGQAAIDGNQTSMERLKTSAVDLGSWLGRTADDGLGPLIMSLERGLGPMAGWISGSEDAAESTTGFKDALVAAAEEVTPGKLGRTADEIADVGDAAGTAADEVVDLDTAFAQLQGRFSGDQAIRNLHDSIRELRDAELDLTGVTYDMATGFDQSTQAGGAVAAQLEDVFANLVDVADATRNGTATSLELADAQNSAEAAVRDVAAALGLNEEQTAALVAQYARLPEEVTTNVNMGGNAVSATEALAARLRNMDGKTYNTYIMTHTLTSPQRVQGRGRGGSSYMADGGVAYAAPFGGMGVPTMVNDGAGIESAWLGRGDPVLLPAGSMVKSAEDTERMMLDQANSGGGRMVLELRGDGSDLGELLLQLLRKTVKNQGGGVVEVFDR